MSIHPIGTKIYVGLCGAILVSTGIYVTSFVDFKDLKFEVTKYEHI